MRTYELVCAGFFGILTLSAPAALRGRRRSNALAIGAAGLVLVWSLSRVEALPGGGVLRDFVPGFILLLTYWQTGSFVVVEDTRFQEYLARLDRRWLPWLHRVRIRLVAHRRAAAFFEGAYLMCYPSVPLGVAALYLVDRVDAVNAFWMVVLPATFLCQGATMVFRSWPPWLVFSEETPTRRRTALKRLNEWVTEHASIRANTFPSGHVACSFAIAFVLLTVSPGLGILFVAIAASTAVSTIVLGYHYSLDVVLGFAVAVSSFLVL